MDGQPLRLFISRSLTSDSILAHYLRDLKVEVTARSLIHFSAMPFVLPEVDWLFFYSKSGVKYFFQQIDPDSVASTYNIAAFGPATASLLRQCLGRAIEFEGSGNAKDVTPVLLGLIQQDSIGFVCGTNSLHSVQQLLPSSISHHTITVYDNQVQLHHPPSQYDIAILSSPMNATGFFESGCQALQYISIGPTTTDAIASYGHMARTAARPQEAALKELLKTLIPESHIKHSK